MTFDRIFSAGLRCGAVLFLATLVPNVPANQDRSRDTPTPSTSSDASAFLTDFEARVAASHSFEQLVQLCDYPIEPRERQSIGLRRRTSRGRGRGRSRGGTPPANAEASAEIVEDAKRMRKTAVESRLVAAATEFAANTAQPQQVRLRLGPIADHAQYRALAEVVEPEILAQAQQIFDARRTELLEQFAAQELEAMERIRQAGTGQPQDLSAFIATEAKLTERYGHLLDAAEFAELRQRYATTRRALLERHAPYVADRVSQAPNKPTIDAIIEDHLHPADEQLPAAAPIHAARRTRLEALTPFAGFDGADYLNAVYQNDLEEVRRLDAEYWGELKPVLDASFEQMKMLAPLMEKMSGGTMQRDDIANEFDRAMENLSVSQIVLATYLFNYQSVYAACLRDDAVRFKVVTEAPDIVTYNYLNVEVSRSYGWTDEESFSVNPEFARAFKQIGTQRGNEGSFQLVDGLLNSGKITRLKSGVQRMMRTTPCSDAAIPVFEQNLIAIFESLN